MDPASIIPVLPLIIIALFTAKLVSKIIKITPVGFRNASIDGLRGYLAFFVFLHHSIVWYFYLKTATWKVPSSNLYSHFGSTSVALFFMITSFLFFSKLLDARRNYIDWTKLYISRILRILPLYIFAGVVILIIVAVLSNFIISESALTVFVELLKWCVCVAPNINNVQHTSFIIAGVVWSLAYEWMFYCSLGIIGVTIFKIRTSALVILVTGFFLILFLLVVSQFYGFNIAKSASFLGGILAAFLARDKKIRILASSKVTSVCMVVLLIFLVIMFSTAYAPIPLLIISVIFIAIACGNSMFGILTSTISRIIGQFSYSIYLLHGIVLFITFKFIIGFAKAAKATPLQHWEIISACAVVVIIISALSHKYVELPPMKTVTRVSSYVNKIFNAKKASLNLPFIRSTNKI